MNSVSRNPLSSLIALWLLLSPAATPAQLVIDASLNDQAAADVVPGEPLLLQVFIENDGETPLVLAPGKGRWPEAVQVEIQGSSLARHPLSFELTAEPPAGPLTLPPGAQTDFLMALPAKATAALQPGAYEVQVSYAISDGEGWRGRVATNLVLRVSDARQQSPQQLETSALNSATALTAGGHYQQARTLLNDYLASNPRSISALTLMAEILESSQEPALALAYASAATRETFARETQKPREPSLRLRHLQRRLWRQLLPPAAEAGEQQATAAPPSTSAEPPPIRQTAATSPGLQSTAAESSVSRQPVSTQSQKGEQTATGVQVPFETLREQAILDDPSGQWAIAARASTEYRPADYSARQATGAPDVKSYSDSPKAWTPSSAERQPEWLELSFAKAVHAREVRVRQSFNPGTIIKVEAIKPDGTPNLLWSGRDANTYPNNQIAWFAVRFETSTYPVQQVRLTLDTRLGKGWKQIDAVQLVGE